MIPYRRTLARPAMQAWLQRELVALEACSLPLQPTLEDAATRRERIERALASSNHKSKSKSKSKRKLHKGARKRMPLVEVVIVLVVVGVLLWLVNQYVPMLPVMKQILNAVVVIAVIIWLLKVFGVWHYIWNIHT